MTTVSLPSSSGYGDLQMSFDYPRLVAGTMLAMSLVGVVHALLLQGLRPMEAMTLAEVRGSFV